MVSIYSGPHIGQHPSNHEFPQKPMAQPRSSLGIKNLRFLCLVWCLSFQISNHPLWGQTAGPYIFLFLVLVVSLFLHHVSSLSQSFSFNIYIVSMDFLLFPSFPLFSLLAGFLPPPCKIRKYFESIILNQTVDGFCGEGLDCQNPDGISSLNHSSWRFLLQPFGDFCSSLLMNVRGRKCSWMFWNCCQRDFKLLLDNISSIPINPLSSRFLLSASLLKIQFYSLIYFYIYCYCNCCLLYCCNLGV